MQAMLGHREGDGVEMSWFAGGCIGNTISRVPERFTTLKDPKGRGSFPHATPTTTKETPSTSAGQARCRPANDPGHNGEK